MLNKIKEFKPEFLLFSAGFDAHIDDPLAQLGLKSDDFYEITKRTLDYAKINCSSYTLLLLCALACTRAIRYLCI